MLRRLTLCLVLAVPVGLCAGCHAGSTSPLLVRGEIIGSTGKPTAATGFVVLDPDTSGLAAGGHVDEPMVSRVKVGDNGVISVRVGFGKDITKELLRTGPTLNFTLVLLDATRATTTCFFSRTADSTRTPTKWADAIPQIRLTVGGGCSDGGVDGPTSETAPPITTP